ncbi:MutS-related protein [Robertkochia solimangrovi]|uniref:MutS-related protein n=1 Tax=Robertkochia solimangrovi TaxID=2213046 RepID=UPI00117FEB1C|nr:hypothetical protein [Robertkochia solimangrovi]TRZ41641.1 hypothetical protein DMZ48_16670 [Robertkochia solimangrovi]
MNKINDLNLKEEVFPLFDYALNSFTRKKILELLEHPLISKDAIENRQQIFAGYLHNHEVLKDYTYAEINLNEVYLFLKEPVMDESSLLSRVSFFEIRRKLEASFSSKILQFILLFDKLQTHYLSKIELDVFPSGYQSFISSLNEFLLQFEFHKYRKFTKAGEIRTKAASRLIHILQTRKADGSLDRFWDDLFLFETYLSISLGIKASNLVFPEIVAKGIKLQEFYYPSIENPVKNSLTTQTNVLLINGPNMSGKSTLLRSVSLCIYLGHLGFGIPASYGAFPVFSNLSISINKRDNPKKGYSHFLNEIQNLKEVVMYSRNKSTPGYAVFDEMFNGTNVEDALEICKATITGLSRFESSFFIISTHIQQLRNFMNPKVSAYYMDCTFENQVPTFTYSLKEGWSDLRLGQYIFKNEGLEQLLDL